MRLHQKQNEFIILYIDSENQGIQVTLTNKNRTRKSMYTRNICYTKLAYFVVDHIKVQGIELSNTSRVVSLGV